MKNQYKIEKLQPTITRYQTLYNFLNKTTVLRVGKCTGVFFFRVVKLLRMPMGDFHLLNLVIEFTFAAIIRNTSKTK